MENDISSRDKQEKCIPEIVEYYTKNEGAFCNEIKRFIYFYVFVHCNVVL